MARYRTDNAAVAGLIALVFATIVVFGAGVLVGRRDAVCRSGPDALREEP